MGNPIFKDPTGDYELAPLFQIWDNRHGSRLEVGMDRDGLGMIEIRQVDEDGEVQGAISMEDAELDLVLKALEKMKELAENE